MFQESPGKKYTIRNSLVGGALALLMICVSPQQLLAEQTREVTTVPSAEPQSAVGVTSKQGFSRDASIRVLDKETRGLLDAALQIYQQPALLANRRAVLHLLHAKSMERRFIGSPNNRVSFADELTGGVFSRRGWKGEYRYSAQPGSKKWYSALWIEIDKSSACLNSRAIEGYLDLPLEPGNRQKVHPMTDQSSRHDATFARPYAKPLSGTTPQLSISIANGCVVDIVLSRNYLYNEVSDENARN